MDQHSLSYSALHRLTNNSITVIMEDDKTPLPAYSASAAAPTVPPEKSQHDREKSSYNETDLPPTYEPPTRFTIGGAVTSEPLVSIQQIKGHLALLRQFAELKAQIQAYSTAGMNNLEDADAKWAWFVGLAVERYVGLDWSRDFCRLLNSSSMAKI